MDVRKIAVGLWITVLLGCAPPPPPAAVDLSVLREQVMNAERAFAGTMAERDHDAFAAFLSDEAIFFSGPMPLRGKTAVAEWWKRYYEGTEAPFSWEPAEVEVLDSGTLALSTGPVRDREGTVIATFTSIWRQESPGDWRIVFDKGCEVCPPQVP